jgi:multidrug efflux pump subunit AcrB
LVSMSSHSANDGSYTLHATFEAGTDLNTAQLLVQNRIALAMPVFPTLVQREGISVRKISPEPLMLVGLTSPDNRFDDLYLSNYATINVKDELARLPGVGDVALFGQREYRIQVAFDPDKLAARQLSATDVVTAIRQQNVQVAAGAIGQALPKGQQFQLTINAIGRLTELEQIESIILKATPDGSIVRLKDVAQIALGSTEESSAKLNGKPAVILSIHALPNAQPSDASRAVRDKLAEIRANAPDGLALAIALDFATRLEEPNNPTTYAHLVIDTELPEGASSERTKPTLERASELLRQTPGVQDVLALTEHPFSLDRNRPCLVVRLTTKDRQEPIAENVRTALRNQIPEAQFRLSVPSNAGRYPVYGFPIEFAIEDRGELGSATHRECTEVIAAKMVQSGKFSDVGVGSGLRRVPVLNLDIDRAKCLALDVEIKEVSSTIQSYFGSEFVSDANQFGRTWQLSMRVDPRYRDRTSDILKLQVKNKQNQLVPIGTVMTVQDGLGPLVVERHEMFPSVRITANLTHGTPLAEARSFCDALAQQVFGTKQLRLIWRVH